MVRKIKITNYFKLWKQLQFWKWKYFMITNIAKCKFWQKMRLKKSNHWRVIQISVCCNSPVHFFILACIGSHGFNCTSPCPPTGYGDLCRFQCSCSADKCDPVNGCTKGPGNFIIINSLLVIFDILVVLYKSVHWINILNYSFVYRKVESSVRPNWLQYKSKSILVHVKTGWYLFSTGNNTVYEMWNYRYFTWKIYTFCMLLSVPSSHSVTFLDVLNRYAHLPVKNNSNRYTEKKVQYILYDMNPSSYPEKLT